MLEGYNHKARQVLEANTKDSLVLTVNSCFKKSLKELIVEQQFYAHKKVKVHFVDWTRCTCMNNKTKLVII